MRRKKEKRRKCSPICEREMKKDEVKNEWHGSIKSTMGGKVKYIR